MSGTQKQGRQPDTYLSYVLRLWYVERQGMGTWRASLQSARSGQRVAFAGLEELCDFLQRETRIDRAAARAGDDEGLREGGAHGKRLESRVSRPAWEGSPPGVEGRGPERAD